MKSEESLAFATIEELAALLAKRKISPVELTELFLRRIERYNPAINAFQTVTLRNMRWRRPAEPKRNFRATIVDRSIETAPSLESPSR